MSIPNAIGEAIGAISDWLNPSNKEKRVLRRAIEAAEQLMMVLRREGKYKDMTVDKLYDLERHFQKQIDSWKDGQT